MYVYIYNVNIYIIYSPTFDPGTCRNLRLHQSWNHHHFRAHMPHWSVNHPWCQYLPAGSFRRDVSMVNSPSVWPLFGKMMIIHGIFLVSHISVFLTSTPSDRRIKSKCVSATVHIDVCGVHSHLTVAVAHLSTTWDNIEVISLPQNPYLVDEQIPFWVESSSLSVQCVKFSSVYQGHSKLRSEALSVMSMR